MTLSGSNLAQSSAAFSALANSAAKRARERMQRVRTVISRVTNAENET